MTAIPISAFFPSMAFLSWVSRGLFCATTRAGHSRKKIMDKCISLFCIYDWVLCNTIHKGMNNNFSGIQYHQVFWLFSIRCRSCFLFKRALQSLIRKMHFDLPSSTFIFHLPSSIWQVRFRVYSWYADRCICYSIRLYHLKQFVFLSIFSENGWFLISSRIPGLR